MVIIVVLVPAAPASAHSVVGPSGSSNYRSTLRDVTPEIPGVSVHVLDDGQHIQLINTTSAPVVVLGYSGEPYLMVTANGVWQNDRSPSLYLNRSSTPGLVYMPPGTDARAQPAWRRVCRCDAAVWHDHRIHWGSANLPPSVSRSPSRSHLVETWQILARYSGRDIAINGELTWVPGPSPVPWLVVGALAALGTASIGFVRRWRIALASAMLALVGLDIARAAGAVLGRGGTIGTQLQGLPYQGVFSLLLWVASLVAARAALRGRAGAPFAVATFGVILALTDGLPVLSVLWHSQVISAYPPGSQRFLTSLTLGTGVGLLAASFILIDRLDKRRVMDDRPREAETAHAGMG